MELKTLIQDCHIHPKIVFRQSRWVLSWRTWVGNSILCNTRALSSTLFIFNRENLLIETGREDMAMDSELNEKRFEIKSEIAEGAHKTPMSLLFNVPSRIVQKIIRYPKPLPLMSCVVILALTILVLIGLDFLVLFRGTEAATRISLFSVMIVLEVAFLSVVLTYFNINKVLVSIQDTLVDFVISANDLANLRQWLSVAWSPSTIRRFFFWWIFISGGSGILLSFLLWQRGASVFGVLIPALVLAFLGGIGMYLPL
jgi:hypothetical protein